MANIAALNIVIKGDNSSARKQFKDTGEAANGLVVQIDNASAKMQSLFTRVVAFVGVGKFVGLASGIMESAHSASMLSRELGMSVQQIQAFQRMVSKTGGDAEEATKGLRHLTRAIGEAQMGADGAEKKFARLGLSQDKLRSMTSSEVLRQLMDTLKNTETATERAAIAADFFGEKQHGLINAASQGADALDKQIKSMEEMGTAMTGGTAEQLESLEKSFRQIKGVIDQAVMRTMVAAAPVIQALAEKIKLAAEWASNFIKHLQESPIAKYALAAAALVAILLKVVTVVKNVTTAMVAMNVAKAVSLALQGPSGWAILAGAAVAAGVAIYGISKAMDSVSESAKQADNNLKQTKDRATEMSELENRLRGHVRHEGDTVIFQGQGQDGLKQVIADYHRLKELKEQQRADFLADDFRKATEQVEALHTEVKNFGRTREQLMAESLRDRERTAHDQGERTHWRVLREDAEKYNKQLQSLKDSQKAAEQAEHQLAELKSKAQQLTEAANPFAKFRKDAEELDEMYRRGLISFAAYAAALKKGKGDLISKLMQEAPHTVTGYMEYGSSEAAQDIARERDEQFREQWAAKQLEAMEKQLAEQGKTNSLLTSLINKTGSDTVVSNIL